MWTILLIILAVLYILSPYDILPDLVIGWGWLDDIVILGFLLRYFYNRKKKRRAFQKYSQNNKNADPAGNRRTENNQSRGHTTEGDLSSRPGIHTKFWKLNEAPRRKKLKKLSDNLPASIIPTRCNIWAMTLRRWPRNGSRRFNGRMRN